MWLSPDSHDPSRCLRQGPGKMGWEYESNVVRDESNVVRNETVLPGRRASFYSVALHSFNRLYTTPVSSSPRFHAVFQPSDLQRSLAGPEPLQGSLTLRTRHAATLQKPHQQKPPTWAATAQPSRRPKTRTSRPSRATGLEMGTSGSSSSSASQWPSSQSSSSCI